MVECSICMKHEMKWLVKQDIRMIVKNDKLIDQEKTIVKCRNGKENAWKLQGFKQAYDL